MGKKALVSIVYIVVVVAVSSRWEMKMGMAVAQSVAQCQKERRLRLNACKPVVYGRPPSTQWCKRIRVTHVECVCPVVTPKLPALIDINRAIRIVQGCGRRVPRYFERGSIMTS